MSSRLMKSSWTAALALSLALGLAGGAQAQDVSLRVDLGHSPHWRKVHGTKVEEVSSTTRPDYDVFRYGGKYYAYNNDTWYASHHAHGDFKRIDRTAVPQDFRQVPREHWRNYPSDWSNDRDRNDQNGNYHH